MVASSNTLSVDAKLIMTFDTTRGPVLSLAFSQSGKYLASGSVDGIQVWDLETKRLMKIPPQAPQEREQVCALCWLATPTNGRDIICYGNAMGFLVLLECLGQDRLEIITSLRVANGREIVCITATLFHQGFARIALGTRDQCIQIWNFKTGSHELTPVQSKIHGQGKNILPKALAFDSKNDLYVFGLFDGGLYKYDGRTLKNIFKHQLGSSIGNAVVDIERRLCVIDNVLTGYDAYDIDSGGFVRNYRVPDVERTHPKGIALGNNSKLVIGGSDHGKVYIFNRKTGCLLQAISHARTGGVETIAVNDSNDGYVYVASASATASYAQKSPIKIWQLKCDTNQRMYRQWFRKLLGILDWVIRVMAVIIICVFLHSRFWQAKRAEGKDPFAKEDLHAFSTDRANGGTE